MGKRERDEEVESSSWLESSYSKNGNRVSALKVAAVGGELEGFSS